MTDTADRRLTHLSLAATRLGNAFARPKVLAVACVVTLTALGWLYLGLLAAGMETGASQIFGALCRPLAGASGSGQFALVLPMWGAMVFAMMLPSAGPMIFTYAEIADTAARKGEPIVSPITLASGYALVWLAFAFIAALMQIMLAHYAFLNGNLAPASTLLSATIFAAAGGYQFSALKHACLAKCRHPFPFFFANWKTTARGVFGLGLKQGLYCLGCCWAMMLVMFAVGVMNVIWMAALGALMTVEKMATGPRFSRALGAVFIATGVFLVAVTLTGSLPQSLK
ncbi:MAG: DUF2182 domain-containing protein [Pseudolabrys sp.]